jgi:hypothetical protein
LNFAVLPDAVPARVLTLALSLPWYAECDTSLESISSSDGHEIFKVLRGLRLNFSKKPPTFPYIQEEGKVGENADFSTLLDTKRKIMI